MTRAGHTALDAELRTLKSVERPAVIKAIAEAREHGDLSENAEYHAAREQQSVIEGRIKELEGILSLAEVIDPAKLSGSIKFGATIREALGRDPDRPARFDGIESLPRRVQVMPADAQAVKAFVAQNCA